MGGGGGPPSMKIINFFNQKSNQNKYVQNALKHEKNKDIEMTSPLDILQGVSKKCKNKLGLSCAKLSTA